MKRIFTAVILILAVFALVFFGQLWMIILASVVVAELAAYEYLQLANQTSWPPAKAAPALVDGHRHRTALPRRLPQLALERQFPLLSALTILLFAWNGFRAETGTLDRVLSGTAKGIFGLIYVAYPLTLIPLLWKQEDGIALIVFLMVCVWAGDIAASTSAATSAAPAGPQPQPQQDLGGQHRVCHRLSPRRKPRHPHRRATLDSRQHHPPHHRTPLAVSAPRRHPQHRPLRSAICSSPPSTRSQRQGLRLHAPRSRRHPRRIDALLLAAPVLWYILLLKDNLGLGRF